MRAVVISAVGAVSAFGLGSGALFDGLREGRSAISRIQSFDASAFPSQIAGEVSQAIALQDMAKLDLRGLPGTAAGVIEQFGKQGAWRDRKVVFGLLAALEAWRMAGCGAEQSKAGLAMGLVLGLGLEQAFLDDFAPIFENQKIAWQQHEAGLHSPPIRYRSDVDLCAQILTRLLRLRGPNLVNASACAAGGLALAQAAAYIERGAADIILCGAADSMVNPFGLGGMSRLGAPSPRNTPDACRPFDSRRDGLVIGEGAAMFVLEEQAHALARGVRPLARVLGYASTQDGYRITAPRPDGSAAARAIQQALERARLGPGEIGYINAHGTGTPLNDVAEARAIRSVFAAHADDLPVSSIKGALGHLMAASGAIEAAACLLPLLPAQFHPVLPGTAHHQQRDPLCEICVIGATPQAANVDAVLSNSFGFGGQNVALILGRWE